MVKYCRDCVNMFFNEQNKWYHYRYSWRKSECAYCGKVAHLVVSFTILGYIIDKKRERSEQSG